METKICRKCGRALPTTSEYFSKDKASSDGIMNRCKQCRKQSYQDNLSTVKSVKNSYWIIWDTKTAFSN